MYGLSDKTISVLKSVFMRYPQIDQAIIYGAKARGDNRRGADIDITLKG
ncbi:MAG: nucleotidyltransferase domain-containing protein [Bacteroidaceae bacterium]|nr:nucleotidyltransferase domain-containing protein [Bacteroidaceae bacterium]